MENTLYDVNNNYTYWCGNDSKNHIFHLNVSPLANRDRTTTLMRVFPEYR